MTLKAKQGQGKTNCHFALRNRKFLYFLLILFDKNYNERFACNRSETFQKGFETYKGNFYHIPQELI